VVVSADHNYFWGNQVRIRTEKSMLRLCVEVSFSKKMQVDLRNALALRREHGEGAEVWIEITALLHGQ
jgi:hypothetical protein